jgi:predicted CopG family antitoxin
LEGASQGLTPPEEWASENAEYGTRTRIKFYICICIYMTSRNISVTDDVYELLTKMKLKNESFSDTIRRLAKRRNLIDCAGAWSDVPEEEMRAFEEGLRELGEKTRRSIGEKTLEVR